MVKSKQDTTAGDGFIYPGVLSDRDIKKAIKLGLMTIESPLPINFQPSSVDVHLAPTIMYFARRRIGHAAIDLKLPVDEFVEYEEIDPRKGAVIHPREFILGVTREWVELSNGIIANVDGKSSLGRLGLVIHATAGFVDPGFIGHITLEITNLTEQPMIIYPNMPIGQFRFTKIGSPAEKSYGDPRLKSKKYKNPFSDNPKPIPSQYWKNLV